MLFDFEDTFWRSAKGSMLISMVAGHKYAQINSDKIQFYHSAMASKPCQTKFEPPFLAGTLQ